MDKLTPSQRSENMSRIRSTDTKPEMEVRRYLHAHGFRYSLHTKKLPGHPDICLSHWHTVIFVNGCFWHRHEGCRQATTPRSNTEFWENKFARNVERDKQVREQLTAAGWKVITVWECEVKKRLPDLPDMIRDNSKQNIAPGESSCQAIQQTATGHGAKVVS